MKKGNCAWSQRRLGQKPELEANDGDLQRRNGEGGLVSGESVGEGAMGVKLGGREVLGEMRRTWSPCVTKGLIFSFVLTLNQTPFDSLEFPPPLPFPIVSSHAPSRAVVPPSNGFPSQLSLHSTNE